MFPPLFVEAGGNTGVSLTIKKSSRPRVICFPRLNCFSPDHVPPSLTRLDRLNKLTLRRAGGAPERSFPDGGVPVYHFAGPSTNFLFPGLCPLAEGTPTGNSTQDPVPSTSTRS